MNLLSVIVKTVVTTIDLFIAIVCVGDRANSETHKRVIAGLMVAQIIGVWI